MILDSLSVKLGFWIPIVSGIPDSLSCFLDFKAQDSGFHKQKFHGFLLLQAQIPGYQNTDSPTWSDMLHDWHHDEVQR